MTPSPVGDDAPLAAEPREPGRTTEPVDNLSVVDPADVDPPFVDPPFVDPVAVDRAVDNPAVAGATGTIWAGVAGSLTLLYVVWYIVDLFVLGLDPTVFNRVHQQSGGLVPRLVFAAMAVGVVAHTADGLRRAACDLRPRWRAHELVLRAAARFVTAAVGIPVVVALAWPVVGTWFPR